MCETNVPDPLAISVRETQLLRMKNFPIEGKNAQGTEPSIKRLRLSVVIGSWRQLPSFAVFPFSELDELG